MPPVSVDVRDGGSASSVLGVNPQQQGSVVGSVVGTLEYPDCIVNEDSHTILVAWLKARRGEQEDTDCYLQNP